MEILQFIDIFKMAADAILDLLDNYLDHPQRVLGSLYRCTEFGWNRHSNFDSMAFLILYVFGLKTPIHAPKTGILWTSDPLNGE